VLDQVSFCLLTLFLRRLGAWVSAILLDQQNCNIQTKPSRAPRLFEGLSNWTGLLTTGFLADKATRTKKWPWEMIKAALRCGRNGVWALYNGLFGKIVTKSKEKSAVLVIGRCVTYQILICKEQAKISLDELAVPPPGGP
jgi:hypothetical protein